MRRPALIVIDMQNDFLEKWPAESRQRLVQSINELAEIIRGAGHPAIWVRQEFEPDLRDAFPAIRKTGVPITVKGTHGCQITAELAVAPSDSVIVKKRYSAFHQTPLDEQLQKLSPDVLIVAGINTHVCVRMTAIDTYQRNWEVILAGDCVDSYDQENHEVPLKYLKQ
jgi:nicotinamidase-related amidase